MKLQYAKCCRIYKRINGAVPDYIDDILKRNADLHTRSTRNASINLVCPKFKRETEGGRTVEVTSTRLWNSIPVDIRTLTVPLTWPYVDIFWLDR